MVEIYRTHPETGKLSRHNAIEKGVWIDVVAPTEEEITRLVTQTGVRHDFLTYSLDPEEKSRIEQEEDQTLIIVDIPSLSQDNYLFYKTIPLGIIVVRDDYIITVSGENTPILEEFKQEKIKGFYTFKKTRFVLQILHQIALYYLKYLREINKRTDEIENLLQQSMRNKELFQLLSLGKSLVYFTTSLKANEIVMEKLLRLKLLPMYEEDEDVLEDAIIENKQAIEMAQIYSDILSNMMDAFASVISNNLNIAMKFLTSVTIVLSMPIMVASFYGMNVALPFQHHPHAFTLIVLISAVLSIGTVAYLAKKKLF